MLILPNMRRRKIDMVESDDPIDSTEQEYLINILSKNELKQYNFYKRILVIFFLLQTPFAVYWKSLRRSYPSACLLSLLSIILSVSSIHFKFDDLRKNVRNPYLQKVVDRRIFYGVNGLICIRLLFTIYKSDIVWRVFFVLPVADFFISAALTYWHNSILQSIHNLQGLKYKYKVN